MVFCFGRGTRTLRFAFGHLALCASLSLGGAPLPLKTQTLLRFLRGFESYLNQCKKIHHPFGWYIYLAGALGLEPRKTVLETVVMPFHHAPKCVCGTFCEARMQYCN